MMGQAPSRIPYLLQNRGLDIFLGSIRRKAARGPCRILMGGTSIATFEPSVNQVFACHLKDQWGDAGDFCDPLGAAGGSFDNPYLGWSKQIYGGPLFRRLRGDNTSTALGFQRYFSRIAVEYSKEVGAGSFSVQIDGATVGTIDCAGPQSYSNVATFDVALGVHTVTINPPASGFVYLERLVCTKGNPGVELIDGCLGGSALLNTQTLIPNIAPAVAGIAIVGDVGLASYFGRTDIDLVIWSGPVNDSGGNGVAATFATQLDTAVAQTAAAGSKLLLICEMGGHFHDPADSNHAKFLANYAKMKAVAAANAHVYALDWHALTEIADIALYQSTYYSVGDFIHPTATAYPFGINKLCEVNRLPLPSAYTRTELNLALRKKSPVPAGTLVSFTDNGSPLTLPAEATGAMVVASQTPLSTQPLVLSASVANLSTINPRIQAGSGPTGTFGTDAFGKYVELNDQAPDCLSGLAVGETVTIAMKAMPGGQAALAWAPWSNDQFLFKGTVISSPGLFSGFYSVNAAAMTSPVWVTFDFKKVDNGLYLRLTGRFYQISVTRTAGQPVGTP